MNPGCSPSVQTQGELTTLYREGYIILFCPLLVSLLSSLVFIISISRAQISILLSIYHSH